MSEPSQKQASELEDLLELVFMFHRGDRDKVDDWLRASHASLGGKTPMDVIRSGNYRDIVDIIRIESGALDDDPRFKVQK